ncbi:hypothetical protein CLOP_g10083 [Closterium sp. NIES-67]|nr:hypothetical protein CLOP_g10083 [Closterium sp. NIES-67]
MTPRADLLDEVKPPGKIKYVAAASAWEEGAVESGRGDQLHQGPVAAAHHPLEWEDSNSSNGSSGKGNSRRRCNCTN